MYKLTYTCKKKTHPNPLTKVMKSLHILSNTCCLAFSVYMLSLLMACLMTSVLFAEQCLVCEWISNTFLDAKQPKNYKWI